MNSKVLTGSAYTTVGYISTSLEKQERHTCDIRGKRYKRGLLRSDEKWHSHNDVLVKEGSPNWVTTAGSFDFIGDSVSFRMDYKSYLCKRKGLLGSVKAKKIKE